MEKARQERRKRRDESAGRPVWVYVLAGVAIVAVAILAAMLLTRSQRLVSTDRGDAVHPRWSPDGSRVAFVHLPDGTNGRRRPSAS